jgi:hypothetical protein
MAATQPHERHLCPSCGAEMVFDPRAGSLACEYCGTKLAIGEADTAIEERPLERFLVPAREHVHVIAAGALEAACARCGAVVAFTPPDVAGSCAFCGTPIVAQPRAADPIIAPESVLPFALTVDAARDGVKRWIASLWFAPNALKRLARHEGLSGVYLPFWTYDARTTSEYRGERGEHYYVTEQYTETDSHGRRVSKTRQVRHTRWYPASGRVARDFDDVLVPATTSLTQDRLRALEPWDLSSLAPYQPAFLSGFRAQRYQVTLEEGFEIAKRLMTPGIDADVRRDIGGDDQRVTAVDTAYDGVTFKHTLLPVYLGAYRFREKAYQVMVNARTGEVQGERPWSAWKIAFLVVAILLILAVVVLLRGR